MSVANFSSQAELEGAEIAVQSAVQSLVNLGLPLTFDQVRSQQAGELVDQVRWLGLPSDLTAEFDPLTDSANLLPVVAPRAGGEPLRRWLPRPGRSCS